MKNLALIVCFLTLLAGVTVANEAAETITQLSEKQMSKDPGALPGSGIVTGGQPTADTFKNLAGAGFVTVIDMRAADEDRGIDNEQGLIEELGMTYVAFPIADKDEISFENAAVLDEMLSGIDGPVLVHCASGNRVGALFALRAKNKGASSEEALAIGKAAGMTRLEKLVRERFGLK